MGSAPWTRSVARNAVTRAARAPAGPRRCRSWPAGSITSSASGMRRASKVLFAGGTTRSRLPQTTRVGARIAPRNGMLDQLEIARECHSAPTASGLRPGARVRPLTRRSSSRCSPAESLRRRTTSTRAPTHGPALALVQRAAGRRRRRGRTPARRLGPHRLRRAPRRRERQASKSRAAGTVLSSHRRRARRS